jgi:Methyltransferase FkbM domain
LESDRATYLALNELVRRYERQSCERARSEHEPLTRYEHRVFSQNGEDGVIAELLRRIGVAQRWFVEFGAQTGVEGNCVFLADVLGWSGLFLEAQHDASNELARKYSATPAVRTRRALVRAENVDVVFNDARVPDEIDVLSIDVDGNDYWIWRALTACSPRIVVIEYNGHWPLDGRWVQPYDPERVWSGSDNYGSSLGALRSLGTEKGYRLVHTELTGNNAFFVRADLDAGLPAADAIPLRAPNHFLLGASHPAHQAPTPPIVDLDKFP